LPYLPEKADLAILQKEKTKIANFAGLNSTFETKMKEYYLIAIELGYMDAMTNLGIYYQSVEKDY
jgi:TPR repeat protein